MRLIIAGSRHFTDYATLEAQCDRLLKNTTEPIEVVCGEAKGADTLGKQWAQARGHEVKSFPALWEVFGRSAGYIRNKQMAEYATHCICFWDGKSVGTQMMINLANQYKLGIRIVKVSILPEPKTYKQPIGILKRSEEKK